MREGHISAIVGGTSGIGRAMARALARSGGDVLIVGRNADRLAETLSELQALRTGRHTACRLDASDPDDMDELGAICRHEYGRVDLLVVSVVAGPHDGHARLPQQVRDLSLVEWNRVLDVNLHGVFLANRAILPLMLERQAGDILNVCSAISPQGLRGRAHASAYSASKFALAKLTACLADEVSSRGIRINAIFPGPVRTPLIEGTMLDRAFGGRIEADDFAEAVVGLLGLSSDCIAWAPYILPIPQRPSREDGGVQNG